MKALRWTSGIAGLLTMALIVLGAVVRRTNSGLSCPDWPTCYGHMVLTPGDFASLPPTGYFYWQVMLEWTHRLIAGTFLGPLLLVVAVLAVTQRRKIAHAGRAAGLMILLLVIQAALGGVTVLDQNSPWSVAIHLGNALLLLTVIFWLFERSRKPAHLIGAAIHTPQIAALSWITVLVAMMSAAMVAKSGASLACTSWPFCGGEGLLPDLSDWLVFLHMAHRVLAAITAIAILVLFMATRNADASVTHLGSLAFGLAVLQILIGAVLIFLLDPIAIALLHEIVGTIIFAVVTLLLWRSVFAADNLDVDHLARSLGNLSGEALRGARNTL
ncbi:cytochrome c oxidase assembly protein subunit 15 [Arboricoccus pini]|uniref:Cytochrome c oxidase assembly protein subunit 15 n=1 Tax=Arboricoccus pini TaxID=1963835 RepID=A0A212QZD7_9PROT|nr:COX15/CtaA family protein [Arboricoccus pini]SNB65093.1 cytochrome c oxidase assembly protein subunit 15 [Arboricoccus pini]